ncbi:unnamed protein product, partial [Amoebophrya sp. A25]
KKVPNRFHYVYTKVPADAAAGEEKKNRIFDLSLTLAAGEANLCVKYNHEVTVPSSKDRNFLPLNQLSLDEETGAPADGWCDLRT